MSVSLCIHVSVYVSECVSMYVSVCVSVCVCPYFFVCACECVCVGGGGGTTGWLLVYISVGSSWRAL